jgi:hypothetical protein
VAVGSTYAEGGMMVRREVIVAGVIVVGTVALAAAVFHVQLSCR